MKNKIVFKTKFGWITASEQNTKILEVKFKKEKSNGKSAILKNFKIDILNYFSKKTKKINYEILLNGTIAQKKIWKELMKIPYGKTKSYGAIAKKLKTSPRFVGNVCSKNNHLLIIPCHRVIRNDGSLGGFSGTGGIKLKKKLLIFENKKF